MSVDGSPRPHDDGKLSDAIDLSNRRFYARQRRTAQRDLKVACLLDDQVAESTARLELGRALLSLGYIDEAMAELTKRASRIKAELTSGGLSAREDWPAIADQMIDAMSLLEHAIGPRLAALPL